MSPSRPGSVSVCNGPTCPYRTSAAPLGARSERRARALWHALASNRGISGPIHPTERPPEARFTVDPSLVPVLPRVVEGGGPPIERGILLCPRPTVQAEGRGNGGCCEVGEPPGNRRAGVLFDTAARDDQHEYVDRSLREVGRKQPSGAGGPSPIGKPNSGSAGFRSCVTLIAQHRK